MCEGVGTRVDDESCAQSVTLLYRNPTWKALQKAAASTTQLYKSGLELVFSSWHLGNISTRETEVYDKADLRTKQKSKKKEKMVVVRRWVYRTD
uniref:Uncharacterized protein n=1 Tax=Parascaris equorum TaxID=6256 RepID=A0A914R7U4_PAREQ